MNSGMFPACISQRRVRGQHPELNPVERVWLFLRERFLSFRVLDDIVWAINTTPRKCLGFLTPAEAFLTYLRCCT